MKNIIGITVTTIALSFGSIAAAADKPEDKAPSGQQTRMKDCNREAGDKQLKGDERKQFMSACLSGKQAGKPAGAPGPAAAAGDNPECAAKALDKNGKPLAGAARSSFMKKCTSDAKTARAQ